MIVKHYSDIPEESVNIPGVKGVSVRWLVDDKIGINFAMRRYEVTGIIPVHTHSHEHEVYVLSGSGKILTSSEPINFKSGDFFFIEPNEPHGFEKVGEDTLIFLCMVPKHRSEAKWIK